MYTHLSDPDLANALVGGDTTAFRELYRRHADSLLRMAVSKIDSVPDAEDCVQEVFCNFWQHCLSREEYFESINLEAYLMASVRHYVFRYYRRQLRARLVQQQVELSTPDADHSTEAWLSRQELEGLLREELDDMPEQMRRVFEMSREQELSVREIATKLELSEQTVKNQISRALRRLRLRLGPQMMTLFL